MSTPAVRQVLAALAAQVGTALGRTVIIDRTDDQPITDDERPALVLTTGDQTFEIFDMSSTLHVVQFDFDVLEDSRTPTKIALRHALTVGAIVHAVHADRSLGGRLQQLEEQAAATGKGDQADLGCATLSFEARWLTPRGDFNTIVGQSGLFT